MVPGSNRTTAVCYFLLEWLHLLWNYCKNLVKLLIGRKHTFDTYYLLLLWRNAACLTGFKPIRSITVVSFETEGAGSQARLYMCAIAFARAAGLTYVHTPFTIMCDADRPMPQWVKLWENYFNFGVGEVISGDRHRADITFHDLHDYCAGVPRAFEFLDLPVPQARIFNQDDLVACLGEFRKKYYLNKSPRYNPVLSVAVHVRRGDVSASDCPEYYTPDSVILKTLVLMLAILDRQDCEYKVAVYSQGRVTDFRYLALPGVEFFINEEVDWTLSELIEADVLLMAKGTYSRYAGLISDGIKLCETWKGVVPFNPLDDWITLAEDGSFDPAAFERQLAILNAGRRH